MTVPYIDGAAVHATLEWGPLIEALRVGHQRPRPETGRLFHQRGDEGLLLLPAWDGGAAIGVKLVTIFPDNPAHGTPSVQAVYVLFDGYNGTPVAVVDGTALTYRKTAADSALGASFLARQDAETLLVVGAGGLAPYLLEAHQSTRPSLRRVLVWNRTHERAAQFAAEVGGVVVDDLDAAVAEADVITCATMSPEPLVRGAALQPGTHIDLVGAYRPDLRESDDDVMLRGAIYVDNHETTTHEAGDLVQPIEDGVIAENDIRGDLFDLCSGRVPGRAGADEITVFKNGGGGHLDLMVARHLVTSIDLA